MGEKRKDPRIAALSRFAVAITLFNLLGLSWFGFEQAWAHPLVALATAYALELLLEWVEALTNGRRPRFAGGLQPLVVFLLPPHITGLAVSMLLYPNARLLPVAFAAAVAIGSKYLFRAPVAGRMRHFFNPSNLGITVTLLLFPWVGIAMPYMFTENLTGLGDLAVPAVIIASGSFLNLRLTRRMPLIAAWAGTFALQAVVRSLVFGTPVTAALVPMTGVAFILFSFYMVSDPATTPHRVPGQLLFGSAVALVYGLLLGRNVVFTLFFALSIVCLVRGLGLYVAAWLKAREPARGGLPVGAPVAALEASPGVQAARPPGKALRAPAHREGGEGGRAGSLAVPEGT